MTAITKLGNNLPITKVMTSLLTGKCPSHY